MKQQPHRASNTMTSMIVYKVRKTHATEKWFHNNVLHRENGPAVISKRGTHFSWYRNGLRHRDDGPALIDLKSGAEYYYINGKKHRLDGPAVKWSFGEAYEWYKHGKLHRTDGGPAVMYKSGSAQWWFGGMRHRVDGPAVIWVKSDLAYEDEETEEYWIYGVHVSEKEFNRQTNELIKINNKKYILVEI